MAAYRRVCDSRHLQADCRNQLRNLTLGNRVWATFTYLYPLEGRCIRQQRRSLSSNLLIVGTLVRVSVCYCP